MSRFLDKWRQEQVRRAAEKVAAEGSAVRVRAVRPRVFPPDPLCATCGGVSAMWLRDVPVTWRERGEIRRVLRSFCCRECKEQYP